MDIVGHAEEIMERILPYPSAVTATYATTFGTLSKVEIMRKVQTPSGSDWLTYRTYASNRPSAAPILHALTMAARAYSERRPDDARVWEDALIRLIAH